MNEVKLSKRTKLIIIIIIKKRNNLAGFHASEVLGGLTLFKDTF